jgi:hypothetical protein
MKTTTKTTDGAPTDEATLAREEPTRPARPFPVPRPLSTPLTRCRAIVSLEREIALARGWGEQGAEEMEAMLARARRHLVAIEFDVDDPDCHLQRFLS